MGGGIIWRKPRVWEDKPRKTIFRVLQVVRVAGDAAFGGVTRAEIRDIQPAGNDLRFTLRLLDGSRAKEDVRMYASHRNATWNPIVDDEPREVDLRDRDGRGPAITMWPVRPLRGTWK
jgi:hypothetical protein